MKSSVTVKLINYFVHTDDEIPAKSARVSYDNYENSMFSETDQLQLTRFLMWNRHTTPFEKLAFVFEISCPIFVARQIMRTRMASYNELSRRYTTKALEFFDYELRDEVGDRIVDRELEEMINSTMNSVKELYKELLRKNVAKEVARQFLPQNLMTKFIMRIDLHNLLNFLRQRTSPHAQKETRMVAEMMRDLVREKIPKIMKMWEIFCEMQDEFYEDLYDEYKERVQREVIDFYSDEVK